MYHIQQSNAFNKSTEKHLQTVNSWLLRLGYVCIYMYIYICTYIYIYVPGTHLSFVFIPKEGLFQSKQGSFGLQVLVNIYIYMYAAIYWDVSIVDTWSFWHKVWACFAKQSDTRLHLRLLLIWSKVKELSNVEVLGFGGIKVESPEKSDLSTDKFTWAYVNQLAEPADTNFAKLGTMVQRKNYPVMGWRFCGVNSFP